MSARKIFFIERFAPYSVELFENLKKFLDTNNDYDLYFIGPDENFPQKMSYRSINNAKKIWSYKHYVRKLSKYFNEQKPDLVHFIFEPRTFGTFLSAIKFPFLLFLIKSKTITIITLRNIFIFRSGTKWMLPDYIPINLPRIILTILIKQFIKNVCKYSSRVIVDTHESKLGLIEYFGIKERKIEVIPVLAASAQLKSLDLKKKEKFEGLFHGKKIILCFGVISSRKGQEEAIKAFDFISNELSNFILIIAGSSTEGFQWYEKKIRKLVKEKNLQNKVFFTGFIDDDEIEILFSMANMSLFIYQQTSASASALSYAIKHNVPSIVSNIPTFTEVLKEKNAIFIKPTNEKQLANAIKKLALDSELRDEIKREMKNIENDFTWEKIALKHYDIYRKLLT